MLHDHHGHHFSIPSLAWHGRPGTASKDLRTLAIAEAANPVRMPRHSSGGYTAAPVATIMACFAVIGFAWLL